MEPKELQDHVLATYLNLRVGIAVIGLALPFFLWVVGYFYAGISLQDSMSAYYHALGPSCRSMRNWFVGALFVVGLFLYLYKGFSRMENYLLNAAGLLAVCVAVKPMPWPDIEQPKTVLLDFFAKLGVTQHGTYAVAFFLCIAIVSHFCADNTLYLVENKAHRAWYKRTYSFISMAMIVSILAAYVLNLVLPYSTWLFAAETLGIEAFAAYWLVKSKELKESSAEPRALALQLKRMNGRLNASSVSN